MSVALVRRALHASHALLTLALLVSGLLIGFPSARGRLVGGYGAQIGELHRELGLLWLVLPGLALLGAGVPLARDLRRRLGTPAGLGWKKLHLAASLGTSCALGATGLLLWGDAALPRRWSDAAWTGHEAASWMLAGLLVLHVVAVRRKLALRLGLSTPEEGDQGDPLLPAPGAPCDSAASISTGTPRGTCTGPARKIRSRRCP